MSPEINVSPVVEDLRQFQDLVANAKTLSPSEKKALLALGDKYEFPEFVSLTGKQLELLSRVAEIETPEELSLAQLVEWAKKYGHKLHFNVVFVDGRFSLGSLVISKRILNEPEGDVFVMDLTNKLTEGKAWENGAYVLSAKWVMLLRETKRQFIFDFDTTEEGDRS